MGSLQEQVDKLQKEVDALKKKVQNRTMEKAEYVARIQAGFFLRKFFIPYFEGVCDVKRTTLEEGFLVLIKEGKTLDQVFEENMARTKDLMVTPEFRVVLSTLRPIANQSNEWIDEKSHTLLDVLQDIRPPLEAVIRQTEGGEQWFSDSLVGIRRMLFQSP